jgi:serine/threonine protein kinase
MHGTSHADKTTTTVFLGDDNSVKLGDFGLSKILQSHDFASTYVGTPFYMSPEICKAEQYGPHSDIWALGCIIYEMCAKQPPFNAKTHFDLIQKIKSGRYPDIPACYSAELRKVIASCLQVTPDHRPDTVALLNLPIVKLMSWQRTGKRRLPTPSNVCVKTSTTSCVESGRSGLVWRSSARSRSRQRSASRKSWLTCKRNSRKRSRSGSRKL